MTDTFVSQPACEAARIVRRLLSLLCLAAASPWLHAHGASAGDVRIEHPFATPAAADTGTVYLKALRNGGSQADRLLGASTPVAARVELQAEGVDANGLKRMQAVGDIAVAAATELKMRPGQGTQLRLIGLRRALRDGDTFPMTLEFERGGKVEVKVYVQTPR